MKGRWETAKYDAHPDIAGSSYTLPGGEDKIECASWIWEQVHPMPERKHDTKSKTIIVTIVKDAAATQHTVMLNWKEHILRTGIQGVQITTTTLDSEEWRSEGLTAADLMTIMGDCLHKELKEQYENVIIMYSNRADMDARVRPGERATDVETYDCDHEIIVDFTLFTRGSPRKQIAATREEEGNYRTIHSCEEDVIKTYNAYLDFEQRSEKTTFVPTLKMTLDAAKYHSQPRGDCAYANKHKRGHEWQARRQG